MTKSRFVGPIIGRFSNFKETIRKETNFELSYKSLKAYYRLRDSMLVEPEIGANYSEDQKKEMWKSKNKLRACLMGDLKLLFKEENRSNK